MDFGKVDVQDFLSALGVKVSSISGINAIFSCPFHGSDRHPSARMNVKTTQFICSTCKVAGNAISFLAKLRNMSNADARYHIEQRYGASTTAPIGDLETEVRRNIEGDHVLEEQRVAPSEQWIENFMRSWDQDDGRVALQYMFNRGFTWDTIKTWEIGFDLISGRIAIPVRDIDGNLVGFKGRAFFDSVHPRYLILGDALNAQIARYGFHTYRKSEHIYGLHRYDRAHRDGCLVVVEGELNVVAMSQKCPARRVGAVAGSEFSEAQRRLICSSASEAIVYFDDDIGKKINAGRLGVQKVAQALIPHMPVRVVLEAPGDAAELDAQEIERLLAGAESAVLLAARGDLELDLHT